MRRLASGEAGLAVGTHALLTEGVEFDRLGLAIIDEQHRFGVEQRARLRAKGVAPHTLHMTATPIPRTLAQSVYADLDVSIIDELPPGRTPIETYAVRTSRLGRVYDFVRANVARGQQAYVVAPAIEEGETELTAAVAEAERLRSRGLSRSARRAAARPPSLARERRDRCNASCAESSTCSLRRRSLKSGSTSPMPASMVVLDAQRYGLAQLHQLRGRVGRGAAKSYCVLVYPDERGESRAPGYPHAIDRRLRNRRTKICACAGPGEFAGTAQSGAAELRLGDLVRDIDIYRARRRRRRSDRGARSATLERPSTPDCARSSSAQPSTRALLLSS